MISTIIILCAIITATILINSRIYWLVKVRKDDPLKVISPWWIVDEETTQVNEYFGKG